MLKKLTPFIFLVAALGLFFFFIEPQYELAKDAQSTVDTLNGITSQLNRLSSKKDALTQQETQVSQSDTDRLNGILPDTVDNVRLILDLDSMARKYGMSLRNIKFSAAGSGSSAAVGMINMSFSVSSNYASFKSFLEDLEDSLRIVDVTSLHVGTANPPLYDFDIGLQTYWLK